MKKIKGVFGRLRAKARGLISRGGDGGGAPPKDGGGERFRESGGLWRLAPFVAAITVAAAVSAGLSLCEPGANYDLPPFVASSCEPGSRIAGNMSVGAGVGFLVFLFMEVSGMVLAQFYRERRREAAERRAESAERKAEIAELTLRVESAKHRAEVAEHRAEVVELKAEAAEQSRRAEVAELSRRVEVAEQARRAEAERAARLELELELATRNGAKNGGGESG